MFRFAYGLIALLAVSLLVAAAHLHDGEYKILYSAAECGIGTQYYLDLTKAIAKATFNPIAEANAQTWKVGTSITDSTWQYFDSTKFLDARLGYPNQKKGTCIHGAVGNDSTYFNIVNTGVPNCYYIYPFASWDVGLNRDTELRNKNRFAYFHDNTLLPIMLLKFTKVK